MLPARIGRYEVLGQLAAGGMAEILLARLSGPADFKRAVVIKRILRGYAAKEEFVKMFLDEARIIASLQHANVVHVQELGESEGEAFLVMEYVAGENASGLLKRTVASGEPLDPRLAAYIVAEVCAGLHAAHELTDDSGRSQNLVHRDVSPQNVLIAYDGHVKLVDFGVALVEKRDARTEPGEVKGKFDYMSPEQGLGKPLDRRSDIFSLGIVLYELSTGRRLFKRPSAAKTIEAICREPIVPPSRTLASYPTKLDEIVMKALAKSPADRYATAAEMRRDLLEIARDMPSPVEALAERMRRLFPDRIAEKDDMLRRVGAGDELSHVPQGDTDEQVEVPIAPEGGTLIETDPRLASQAARRWRRTAAIAIGAAIGFILLFSIVIVRLTQKPESAALAANAATPANEITNDEVVVHIETKPPGARVVVGGHDKGESPLELRLAKGTEAIPIELRRQGYTTVAQQLVPDSDQKLVVGLTPVPVRGRPAARPVTKSAPASAPTTSGSAGFRRFD